MSELITISGVRGYIDENGVAQLNLEDVARGLGFTTVVSGKEYVRWNTVKDYLVDLKFLQEVAKDKLPDFIPENIFYRLAMKAKNETAEKFQVLVADEILPAIHKHGAYMTPAKIEEVLLNPDTIIKLATELKSERQKRQEAEQIVEKQKPLVGFAEHVSVSMNSILVREVAKVACKNGINIGEKRLYVKLRDWGLIMKDSTEPQQEFVNRGYFEVVEGSRESAKGVFTYRTTRVTGRGQIYIINRLKKEMDIAV